MNTTAAQTTARNNISYQYNCNYNKKLGNDHKKLKCSCFISIKFKDEKWLLIGKDTRHNHTEKSDKRSFQMLLKGYSKLYLSANSKKVLGD